MPLITKAAIERRQERREAGLWATVVSLASQVREDSVDIEMAGLLKALSLHPRLIVQPVSNKVWVPGADTKPLLGDMIERAAKPIAKALSLPCLDSEGKLKADSGCGKRKAWLNRVHTSVRKAFGK
jgi:hypothetical protein